MDRLTERFFITWFIIVFTVVIASVVDILILEPTSLIWH